MHRLALLLAFGLVLTACDTTEEPPPQATQFIRGTYTATWTGRADGPGPNRRTEVISDLLVRMEETEGTVVNFPGAVGDLEAESRQIDVNNGDITNRRFFGVDLRSVTGTYNRQTRDFQLRIQGERGDYELDVTFTGQASTTYTQLAGQMVGEMTTIDQGSGNRVVAHAFDDAVTLAQQ